MFGWANPLQPLSQGLVLTLRFTFDPELDISPTSCCISDHLNHQLQKITPASCCLGGERRAEGVGEIFQDNFCKYF